jgi:GDP-L-fucose synthase
MLDRNRLVFVAGHMGMVGSALLRKLKEKGFKNFVLRPRTDLDLTDSVAVKYFFKEHQPDYVFLAAAQVGGIYANNTYPADFIYINLMIQCNIIEQAYRAGVEKLLFLGSSCIYPKFAPQPMKEEYLLTGELEQTNEPYAIAKIAGIKMCESYNRQYGTSYRSVMPTNLYGPGDNYDLQNSHVIPAMIRKYHLAKLAMEGDAAGIQKDEATYGPIPEDIKEAIGLTPDSSRLTPHASPKVLLWGTGEVYREFLHVDDMASACIFIMNLDPLSSSLTPDASLQKVPSFVNVGTGRDQTIAQTAAMVGRTIGFTGETIFDTDKPDGTPKKLLDTTRINKLGWYPELTLEQGLADAYKDYLRKLE